MLAPRKFRYLKEVWDTEAGFIATMAPRLGFLLNDDSLYETTAAFNLSNIYHALINRYGNYLVRLRLQDLYGFLANDIADIMPKLNLMAKGVLKDNIANFNKLSDFGNLRMSDVLDTLKATSNGTTSNSGNNNTTIKNSNKNTATTTANKNSVDTSDINGSVDNNYTMNKALVDTGTGDTTPTLTAEDTISKKEYNKNEELFTTDENTKSTSTSNDTGSSVSDTESDGITTNTTTNNGTHENTRSQDVLRKMSATDLNLLINLIQLSSQNVRSGINAWIESLKLPKYFILNLSLYARYERGEI